MPNTISTLFPKPRYRQHFLLCLLWFLTFISVQAQDSARGFSLDANYFYGSILRHSKDISHLITGHPEGLILGYNIQSSGEKRWQQAYNYPDYGMSFIFQNSKNEELGNTYGLFAHYNFYFLKRQLFLRIGQGVSYATNPFDLETNFKNSAYGSRLLSSTYLMLNYKKSVYQGFGIQMGLTLLHHSNGNTKAPNTSTNSLAGTVGFFYDMNSEPDKRFLLRQDYAPYSEPWRLYFMIRGGANESDFLNLGQHPFFVLTGGINKRFSYKSSIMAGVEYFHSIFLKKEIEYVSVAFPKEADSDDDFRRLGVFGGYQLHIGKLGVLGQLGYYAYYPYDFQGRLYVRAGIHYEINNHWFLATSVKAHGAKAEALEFGIGYQL